MVDSRLVELRTKGLMVFVGDETEPNETNDTKRDQASNETKRANRSVSVVVIVVALPALLKPKVKIKREEKGKYQGKKQIPRVENRGEGSETPDMHANLV
jgi:hypothetical protein